MGSRPGEASRRLMMSAVLSNFSEAIAVLFQSFRLAFVLPAFIFWSLNAFFVLPILPQQEYLKQWFNGKPGNQLAALIALSFLSGYFLAIVNIWLIRLFEGYHWKDSPLARRLIADKRDEKQELESPLRRIGELEAIRRAYPRTDERRRQAFKELELLQFGIEPETIQELHERF